MIGVALASIFSFLLGVLIALAGTHWFVSTLRGRLTWGGAFIVGVLRQLAVPHLTVISTGGLVQVTPAELADSLESVLSDPGEG